MSPSSDFTLCDKCSNWIRTRSACHAREGGTSLTSVGKGRCAHLELPCGSERCCISDCHCSTTSRICPCGLRAILSVRNSLNKRLPCNEVGQAAKIHSPLVSL